MSSAIEGFGGTRVKKIPFDDIKIDQRELAARLGGETSDMPTIVYGKLKESVSACYSLMLLPLTLLDDAVIINECRIESRSLARAFRGCDRVLLLAATLGFSLDRLISRLGPESVSEQFYADSLADALIEGVCDYAMDEARLCGLGPKNRFSPGYGDLPLSLGEWIVRLLGADRTLGIRYTESGLALPKKTVTAFVGVLRAESNN